MNVTQVLQSAGQINSKAKEPKGNGEEFSKALESSKESRRPKEKPSFKEETQTEENDKHTSKRAEAEEQDAERTPFTLVNPFLNLEAKQSDLAALGKRLTVHTEHSASETDLNGVTQAVIDEIHSLLSYKEMADAFGDSAGKLTQEELAQLVSLTDTEHVKEALSLTEAGEAVAEFMESVETLSDANSYKARTADMETEEQHVQPAKTDKTSTKTGVSESSEADKTEPIRESKTHSTVSAEDSKVSQTGSSEGKPLESSSVLPFKEGRDSASLESSQLIERTNQETDSLEQTLTQAQVKAARHESDTEAEFVSMLRQLSQQTSRTASQPTAAKQLEQPVFVSKEQGMELIQDMATTIVENKDGQTTYQTTLHLTPETLGKVTVELSFSEEGLSGKLTFQSDEARRWMEGEWLDLKSPLEAKGITLNAFDFETSQPAQQQTSFSFSEQSSQSGQDSQHQSPRSQLPASASEKEQEAEETGSDQTNGLNVYV